MKDSSRGAIRTCICAVIVVIALAACNGEDNGNVGELAPPAAPESLIQVLIARQEAAGRVQPFDSIAETLESTLYRLDDADPQPITEAVVVGEVEAVGPGKAFGDETEESVDGEETHFDDPSATYRTIHVTMNVTDVISGEAPAELVFGVAVDPRLPLEAAETELKELDPLLLFLNRSPVFAYEPAVYGTLNDGGLIGTVDVQGRISLPVQDPRSERALLRGATTIEDLRTAARAPDRVVRLDATGARRDQRDRP